MRRFQTGLRFCTALVAAAPLATARPGGAVIVIGGEDGKGRNLSPPTGEYKDSGWEFQGVWGAFTGTAIGPHHFLTAKHVGGQVGNLFFYEGRAYETINYTAVPGADLNLWTVAGTFRRWAPLYEGGGEQERQIIFFGRGTQRGNPVVADGRLRGWEWGSGDGRLSWGTGRVAAVLPFDVSKLINGGKVTQMLAWGFERSGGPNEGSISSGDSGGGVFVKEGDVWKLCGINHGVTGAYSVAGFATFPAALFDAGGLYRPVPGGGMARVGGATPLPTSTISLATRTSPFVTFLRERMQEPPRRQFLTRRRGVALAGAGVVAAVGAFAARVRRRLRERRAAAGAPPTA